MSRGLRLRLALRPREVLHVDLQWIAVRSVAIDQLARQFHFFVWDLV